MIFLFTFLSFFQTIPSIDRLPLEQHATSSCPEVIGIIAIDQIGPDSLERLKSDYKLNWWIELNRELIVEASLEILLAISFEYHCELLAGDIDTENLVFLKLGKNESDPGDLRILSRSGAYALAESKEPLEQLNQSKMSGGVGHHDTRFWAFESDTVLVQLAANTHFKATDQTRAVQDLVDLVDGNRWYGDVETLASYNRYTHGSEVLDARDWLVSEFEGMSGLTVTTESFSVSSTTAYNVMAVLPGSTQPDDWYIIGAHYDSISEATSVAAPGAEDNGSGTAGVLEMARIFSANPPEATLVFICFSGEEQGLYGSKFHVTQLESSGNKDKVKAVINMDMIGYTGDAELDCLLESRSFASNLNQELSQAAATYTNLVISTTLSAWGSDHVPYLDALIPAVLTIENDWSSYSHYHRTTDLPEHITIGMGEEILKMNVAALAEMTTSRAELAHSSTQLHNPGPNGVADPGEILQLNLIVENLGDHDASVISVTVSSSDPLVTVTQHVSNYPNINAHSSAANLVPFEIHLDSSFPCGDLVQLSLELSYTDFEAHVSQQDISIGTGTMVGVSEMVSPGLAIPDNDPTGITSSMIFSGSNIQVSSAFNIDIDITHTYIGDLTIDLESPAHTMVRLWDNSGSGTNDLVGNFPKTLTSAGDLADFAGEDLDGSWLLHITDTAGSDTGTLNSWGINDIQGFECEDECVIGVTISSEGNVPAVVSCAGDVFSLECSATGVSGSEGYQWTIDQGAALIIGNANQPNVSFELFDDATTIRCTVTEGSCSGTKTFMLTVDHVSLVGDAGIDLFDLFMLMDLYWSNGQTNPSHDYNSDGVINLLDFIDFSECL